jgi:choice-of-anchor C domain-containing protein
MRAVCLSVVSATLAWAPMGPLVASAVAEQMLGESIEWLVSDCDVIVLGTMGEIHSPAVDAIDVEVALAVSERLKGNPPERLKFAVRVHPVRQVFEGLRKQQVPVLAFLKEGQLRQMILPAGEKSDTIIHNSMIWRAAITIDGRVLWDHEAILAAIREAAKYGAERPSPSAIDIDVAGTDAWDALWAGSGVHLKVPLDGRVEGLARTWSESADVRQREAGRRLLTSLNQLTAPAERLAAYAASSPIVANGGFEHRTVGDPPAYIQPLDANATDLAGWQVTEGSVDWIGPARWRASEGMLCVDIDAPGGIKQTIQTIAGLDYLLRFDMAGNPETEPAAKRLVVTVGEQRHEFAFDATGHTTKDLGWTSQQIPFRAVGERTVIKFTNAADSPTASGLALDNVFVEAVSSSSKQPDAPDGRYQLAVHEKQLIMLDTRTGESWILTDAETRPWWKLIRGPGDRRE